MTIWGKFRGNVVLGILPDVEGVDGSKRVSGSEKEVSHDVSTGSFTKFGLPCVNACVVQCGRNCVKLGG